MAPGQLEQRRAHNLLLISKLLNGREASPFTLIIDSLEQSGKPLIREYIRRATIAKTKTIYVSFETLKPPRGIDCFIPACGKDLSATQNLLATTAASKDRRLVIFDTLNTIAANPASNIPGFLLSLISPTTSVLAVYHKDIPLRITPETAHNPPPLALLKYMSTAIITTHSLHHILLQKSARDRSLAEPLFGLEEGVEGMLRGLGSNDPRGIVLEMEYRRKSGRGVREWFFIPSPKRASPETAGGKAKEIVILLEDHPLYRRVPENETDAGNADEGIDSTFNLSLTERQRQDRERVVLPYFDAQKGEGGEGGRILYDMGEEDDFDEEEDEI